jgi:phage terminase large subunit-like protein
LVEGENAGKTLILPMWQKWLIHSIFSFYGNIPSPTYDEEYNYKGSINKYVRIINDVTLLIASGNSKTTLLAALNCCLLFNSDFPSPQIFIGSDAYRISKLCFSSTAKMLRNHKSLEKYITFRESFGEIEYRGRNAKITAMSSVGDNQEGIIPSHVIFDEIHTMRDSSYVDNIKKNAKREDQLFFELSTQGTVRGGYLDGRLDYLRQILSGDIENDRVLPVIFEQDSEDEIFQALNNNEYDVLFKSNPSLGTTISTSIIAAKIKEMVDNPTKKVATLTKNFNIPQNPETSYFSETECRAKPFDEGIWNITRIFIFCRSTGKRKPVKTV